MSDEKQPKRKVSRGRQAPMHTLEESLRFLDQIRQAIGTHPGGRDMLLQALGHKAGSGTGCVKVGAMSHFGLLRAKKGGTYQITPLAQRILFPRDDAEYQSAIAEAARSPALYAELITQFAGQQVPKLLGNLLARNYGVTPKNAEEFAERFRNTMEFATLLRNGVLHSEPVATAQGNSEYPSDVPNELDVLETQDEPTKPHATTSGGKQLASTTPSAPTQEYTIPLGRDGELAIIQVPVPLQESYLRRIESWAAYMRSMLEDDGGTQTEEGSLDD